MKRSLLIVLVIASIAPGATIWPMPQEFFGPGELYSIAPSTFQIVLSGNAAQNQVLTAAVKRYTNLVFHGNCSVADASVGDSLASLVVSVSDTTVPLGPGIDESYTLYVDSPSAALSASTVWGALHGLESFSQLVMLNDGCSYQIIQANITDYPRFPHRGLMIDSSRHFLPVATILRTIDAMVYNKLNVLHWHLVDAIAFPVQSVTYPDLSKGAYTSSLVYAASDIQTVVSYAYARGIRVMPEFDTPGHAYSWGVGYPNITAVCPDWSANVNNVALDPTNPFTNQVVHGFLGEMGKLFMDPYMHTGGDEVVYQCWQEDQAIMNWLKQQGYTSLDQLMQYYEDPLWAFLAGQNKQVVAWEEIFNGYNLRIPKNIIIEVWQDEPTLLSVAQASVTGMLAYGWYLNQLTLTWTNFYQNEPFSSSAWTPSLEKYIIGGEICAWGETLNQYNYDQRLWPRSAAAAERLWSSRNINNPTTALPRLEAHICLLNRRGIAAEPLAPGFCP